jgi:hypothetical protein
MEFSFEAVVKVTASHQRGDRSSKHVATDFRLEVSKNLADAMYNDADGLPTKDGADALTKTLVQGLIGCIHMQHQRGWKNDAENLRSIIAQLEKGFVSIADLSKGEM